MNNWTVKSLLRLFREEFDNVAPERYSKVSVSLGLIISLFNCPFVFAKIARDAKHASADVSLNFTRLLSWQLPMYGYSNNIPCSLWICVLRWSRWDCRLFRTNPCPLPLPPARLRNKEWQLTLARACKSPVNMRMRTVSSKRATKVIPHNSLFWLSLRFSCWTSIKTDLSHESITNNNANYQNTFSFLAPNFEHQLALEFANPAEGIHEKNHSLVADPEFWDGRCQPLRWASSSYLVNFLPNRKKVGWGHVCAPLL